MSYATHSNDRSRAAQQTGFDWHAAVGAVNEGVDAAVRATARAFRAAAARFVERRTITALARLDDRTLQDIGVHRSEIRYLARRLSQGAGHDYGR